MKQCKQVANKLVPLVSSLVQRRPGAAQGGGRRGDYRPVQVRVRSLVVAYSRTT